MFNGLPLAFLVIALTAGLYAAPDATLKWAALAGLGFLYVFTALPTRGRK